jgi:hypothetical protein
MHTAPILKAIALMMEAVYFCKKDHSAPYPRRLQSSKYQTAYYKPVVSFIY